ncbi:MAG: bifunctional 4-hydroxy-2-oxoglutarate aldolase/2-dehydro-3-deoxy-phosphogluconate aldolase, partial [Treponema sp.]|nr:bifunctional 4-hydroxy-2-oxoglutarate aldolase/2-dehydro-3-deoxy-phosphogluconate aldolase [Treponema sp.]
GEEGYKKIAGCIKKIASEVPEMLTGAGTVINASLAQRARNAGARFIVSPGFNPLTIDWCINNNLPVYPGIDSPSLVEAALEKGLDVLKFFPAEVSGGVKMLNALRGPFPQVRFIPTGGVNLLNLESYIKCPNVIAAGGSWMVPENLIENSDWKEIETLSRNSVGIIKNCRTA